VDKRGAARLHDSGPQGTFGSSRRGGKLGSDGPNGLKDQEISLRIEMAAPVRAVFEIGMPRTSVRSKSIVREERESDAIIGRENPVAHQARHPGFGQVCGASGG
jgi:hypothetical protein